MRRFRRGLVRSPEWGADRRLDYHGVFYAERREAVLPAGSPMRRLR